MALHSDMTKAVKIYLSDSEYKEVEELVGAGKGRTKADFVKTATILHIDRCNNKVDVKKEV